jgi:hypothetical protein
MKIGLGFVRQRYWGDVQIDTEWQFQNLQSADSNSEVYTASVCKISLKGEPGVFAEKDKFGKTEEISSFKNESIDRIHWRGRMWCSDLEVEALSSTSPDEVDRVIDPSARLLSRAWNEFLRLNPYREYSSGGQIVRVQDDRFTDSEEVLLQFRDQFDQEFASHIRELGIHFEGLYPGFNDLIQRETTDWLIDNKWKNALDRMREGMVSGELSKDDRYKFFDTFVRKFIKRDRIYNTGFLTIPEALGADAFSILNDHFHIGPLRMPPVRDFDETTLRKRKEWKPWLDLFRDEYLRREVSKSLEVLGVEYEIIKGLQETRISFPDTDLQDSKSQPRSVLRFRASNGNVATSHLDLGFGVSTVLPLVVGLHSDCALLTIEQPELHIHPSLQTDLGDLLVKKALGPPQTGKETTILVETHSEHLILRILRRIRETTAGEVEVWPKALREACPQGIRPEDVAVLFVQSGDDGSEVIELPVDANGEFTCDWPGGFFEERISEFF